MDDFEWLKDKVERLAGAKQDIFDLYSKSKRHKAYSKGNWAFKKLLILAFYIDIFTNVAKKYRDNVVYADLLAGPGFNYLKDLDLVIAGSPLLAKIVPRTLKSGKSKSFDKMILVDNNPKNCTSLMQILDEEILCLDCNSLEVFQRIRKLMTPLRKSLLLSFIDPEGTEIEWETMTRLFKIPGDFVINYPYSGVGRLCGSFHRCTGDTKISIGARLDRYFGTTEWRSIPFEDHISDSAYLLYLEQLKTFRSEIVEFPIMMIRGAQYRILIATKRTGHGSPWLKPVRKLKERIESISDKQLETLVQIYKGNQSQLTDFF